MRGGRRGHRWPSARRSGTTSFGRRRRPRQAPRAPEARLRRRCGAPDENGIRLPEGFAARRVARGGETVPGIGLRLAPRLRRRRHLPDRRRRLDPGVELRGAARAARARCGSAATARSATPTGSSTAPPTNCAGGPTPWGTWLSCEEYDEGRVWECDPAGQSKARVHDAMGVFKHEAAAVDPRGRHVYLTEDLMTARFYRFTPRRWPDLVEGMLEMARVGTRRRVEWVAVPDPLARRDADPPPGAGHHASSRAAEGIWFDSGTVYVATTGDSRIHAYDTRRRADRGDLRRPRHARRAAAAGGQHHRSRAGELFVCEDIATEEIDIGVIDAGPHEVSRFLSVSGPEPRGSELTGVAFDPSGTRLYFSSQRAFGKGGPTRARARSTRSAGPFRRTAGLGLAEQVLARAGAAAPPRPGPSSSVTNRSRPRTSTAGSRRVLGARQVGGRRPRRRPRRSPWPRSVAPAASARPAQSSSTHEARGADRHVGLAEPPGAAEGVGDHHGGPHAAQLAIRRAAPAPRRRGPRAAAPPRPRAAVFERSTPALAHTKPWRVSQISTPRAPRSTATASSSTACTRRGSLPCARRSRAPLAGLDRRPASAPGPRPSTPPCGPPPARRRRRGRRARRRRAAPPGRRPAAPRAGRPSAVERQRPGSGAGSPRAGAAGPPVRTSSGRAGAARRGSAARGRALLEQRRAARRGRRACPRRAPATGTGSTRLGHAGGLARRSPWRSRLPGPKLGRDRVRRARAAARWCRCRGGRARSPRRSGRPPRSQQRVHLAGVEQRRVARAPAARGRSPRPARGGCRCSRPRDWPASSASCRSAHAVAAGRRLGHARWR